MDLKDPGIPKQTRASELSCEVTHCRCHLATTKQRAGLRDCFILCSLRRQEGSRLSRGKDDVK